MHQQRLFLYVVLRTSLFSSTHIALAAAHYGCPAIACWLGLDGMRTPQQLSCFTAPVHMFGDCHWWCLSPVDALMCATLYTHGATPVFLASVQTYSPAGQTTTPDFPPMTLFQFTVLS
jgi:hypothetical protein